MDNSIVAARDAPSSGPGQQNIMHPAIMDWESEDEEGADTTPEPEAITILFERKTLVPRSNLSLLTKLLLQSKKERQEHKSPSTIRRLMVAEEDENCTKGRIRKHMIQERKGNSSPFVQEYIRPGPIWPRGELLNYSALEATCNGEEYKSIQENHHLDSAQRRPNFQSAA